MASCSQHRLVDHVEHGNRILNFYFIDPGSYPFLSTSQRSTCSLILGMTRDAHTTSCDTARMAFFAKNCQGTVCVHIYKSNQANLSKQHKYLNKRNRIPL
jgi:uncharacterized protein (DUF2141 family)